jgi:hypothetical protein
MPARFQGVVERRWKDSLLAALTCALLLTSAAYYFVGFRSLLTGAGETVPVDFRLRWIESRLLLEGKDSHTWGHPDTEFPDRLRWQRELGGGYPPWATGLGLLLAPPVHWSLARAWFAILNLLALVTVCLWAYSIGIANSRRFALFLVAASLACASSALCISYGQYAVLILATILIASVALERKHRLPAGVALGLSLIKPQLAALVVIIAIVRRHYAAVAIAALVVAIGSALMWVFTGIDPYTALRDSQSDARKFAFMSINPLTDWLLPGLGFQQTTLLLGFSFLAVGTLIAFLSPKTVTTSALFAVALVICMFWSYRRGYDCPLLIMPMVLLFEAASKRQNVLYWTVAFAFGISLWLPIRNEQWSWTVVQMGHMIVWSLGAIVILLDGLYAATQESQSVSNATVRFPAALNSEVGSVL